MNTVIHRASERGEGEHGWLHTRFSFSFAHWYEPSRMGFGVLRVLNDDVIDPDSGFGMHPHDNMEIITIVTEGAVTHEDSMGNRYEIPAGDVQVMSAGTGVFHSEFNHSGDQPLKLFQVWIHPKKQNVSPRYAQRSFGAIPKDSLELLVGPDEASVDRLWIYQDAYVYRGSLSQGGSVEYTLHDHTHGAYIFVTQGKVKAESEELSERDAFGIWNTEAVRVTGVEESQFLVFEVPMT